MASEGPNTPGTFGTFSPGDAGWTLTANAGASDNTYTSVTSNFTVTTEFLRGTNASFSIPADSTIDGIEVAIERSASISGVSRFVTDSSVRLWRGSAVGDDKADTVTKWGTSDSVVTYGGASDLWNTTWTAAQINATNFGAQIAATISDDGNSVTARIDHMTITVTYTALTEDQLLATFVRTEQPLFQQPQRAEGYFRKRNSILVPAWVH